MRVVTADFARCRRGRRPARAALDPRRAARAAARRGRRGRAAWPARGPEGRHQAQPTDEWQALRFAWRVMRAREVEHRDLHRCRSHARDRRRADEPRRRGEGGGDEAAAGSGQRRPLRDRRGLGCVLPVPRRPRCRRRGRRDRGRSARRLGARRGGDRGRRRARPGDGVHGQAALPALKGQVEGTARESWLSDSVFVIAVVSPAQDRERASAYRGAELADGQCPRLVGQRAASAAVAPAAASASVAITVSPAPVTSETSRAARQACPSTPCRDSHMPVLAARDQDATDSAPLTKRRARLARVLVVRIRACVAVSASGWLGVTSVRRA